MPSLDVGATQSASESIGVCVGAGTSGYVRGAAVVVGPSNGAAVAGDVVGIAGEGSSPEQAAITHPRMNIVETKLNCLLWLTAPSW